MKETSGIEPEVGLEPTTLRFLFLCNKSHTLYRLSYPGRVVDAEILLMSRYTPNSKSENSDRLAWQAATLWTGQSSRSIKRHPTFLLTFFISLIPSWITATFEFRGSCSIVGIRYVGSI